MPGFELFGKEERQHVQDVLDTGVLFRYGFDSVRNGHWKAKSFEQELARKLGSQYCHLCSSGTAALIIALSASGIGAGDEVIVPPFTFVATIEAVLAVGAVPVFSEIDQTLCLNPDKFENVLSAKTRAIVPVHMCGSMARIDEIKTFCDKKGLILIEDACQSTGASYKDKALGTFGKMGCFSFDPVKTITCGEGGAVITDDETLYKNAFMVADHGHDHIGNDRGLEGHPILGANYRISELNAAVGLAQLGKLDLILDIQRKNKQMIKQALGELPGVSFRQIPDEKGDSATFLSFFLKDEQTTRRAVKELGAAGVDSCFCWFDNNWHYIRKWDHIKNMTACFKLPIEMLDDRPDYLNIKLPESDTIMAKTICMQIKLGWQEKEIIERIDKMTKVLKEM